MIKNGSLSPGDRLCSLRTLSDQFNCNFLTVYHAVKYLERIGLVEIRRGSGVYIKKMMINIKAGNPIETLIPPGPTDKIGVLFIPGQGGHYLEGMLKALHNQSERLKLYLNIRTVSEYSRKNLVQIQSLRKQDCCAVVIPYIPRLQDISALYDLVNSSVLPLILPQKLPGLERHSPDDTIGAMPANKSHTIIACRYFRELGYKNIALLGTEEHSIYGHFHLMMMEYTKFVNIEGIDNYIAIIEDKNASEYDNVVKMWSKMSGDLAVICYFDSMAIRLMTAIHKAGLNVPRDIAVLGYNNITESQFSDPPLSTMQCPYDALAERLLIHALSMSGGDRFNPSIPLIHKLIIRDSCGGRKKLRNNLDALLKKIEVEDLVL